MQAALWFIQPTAPLRARLVCSRMMFIPQVSASASLSTNEVFEHAKSTDRMQEQERTR
jgi:hypothetical protein